MTTQSELDQVAADYRAAIRAHALAVQQHNESYRVYKDADAAWKAAGAHSSATRQAETEAGCKVAAIAKEWALNPS